MSTVVSEEDGDGERGLSGEVTFECRSEGYKPGSPMDIKAVGRRSGNPLAHPSYIAFTWQKPVLVRPNSPPTTHPHLRKTMPPCWLASLTFMPRISVEGGSKWEPSCFHHTCCLGGGLLLPRWPIPTGYSPGFTLS